MVCQFLIKNKNAFTIRSNNFCLDINPKEMKMFTQKSVHECLSVTKLFPTLCNPMDCNIPGFPVLHCFPEFVQVHVI